MSINGISTSYLVGYGYNIKTVNTRGSSFTERMGENVVTGRNNQTIGNQSYNRTVNQTASMDTYLATAVQRCNEIPSLKELFPMETANYKIEDASYVEGVPAYEIVDKQTGRCLYMREDQQLAIQKDAASGFAFMIDMNQPLCNNVRVTDELRGLLNDLAEKRNIELSEVLLQGGLIVNRDPKTGLNYLTIKGNEAKGVSVIITSQEDIDRLERLADEFMQYDVVREREIAGLWALLEISGNLKREGDGFTYLTPDGISYIPYNGDNRSAWHIPYSPFDYSKAREFLAKGSNLSDAYTWLGVFPKAEIMWPDVEPWSQYNKNETGHGFQYMGR